jgi:hypothetical protein
MTILLFQQVDIEDISVDLGRLNLGDVFRAHRQNTLVLSDSFGALKYDVDLIWKNELGQELNGIMKVVPSDGSEIAAEIFLWSVSRQPDNGVILTNIKLTAACGNGFFTGQSKELGQEIVTGKWIQVRSSGVDGDGLSGIEEIVDDNQTAFVSIGGGFDADGDYIRLGDIPPNTARRLEFRFSAKGEKPDYISYPKIIVSYETRY